MNMGSRDIQVILDTTHFAAQKHRLQRRKGPEASAYINHPIEVAKILSELGGVEDIAMLQAAILHDTIEDTETSGDELEREFGAEVRGLVEEVTDDKSLEKSERKRRQIEKAPKLSPRAKQIKIADKICNIRDVACQPPVLWPLQRRQEYLDWAGKVVAGCRGVNPALESKFDELLVNARNLLETVKNMAG